MRRGRATRGTATALFSLPVMVFFLLIQRNLVSGMSAGAVKG